MMHRRNGLGSVIVSAALLSAATTVTADGQRRTYEVTVTNITKGEIFTPVMVASHGARVRLFELGSSASPELEMLAEGGDTGPLSELLETGGALDVVTAADVLPPGESVTLEVATNGRNRYVSVAAMLVPGLVGAASAEERLGVIEEIRKRCAGEVTTPALESGAGE